MAIAKLAEEFQNKKRILILYGPGQKLENGFSIHPTRLEDTDVLIEGGTISREISVAEAIELTDNPFCQNKKTIIEFLVAIKAL